MPAAARKTFNQITQELREAAAAHEFDTALRASRMRHAAVRLGRPAAARALSAIKHRALKRAAELSPRVVVRSATDDPARLLSVRYRGRALHAVRAVFEASA